MSSSLSPCPGNELLQVDNVLSLAPYCKVTCEKALRIVAAPPILSSSYLFRRFLCLLLVVSWFFSCSVAATHTGTQILKYPTDVILVTHFISFSFRQQHRFSTMAATTAALRNGSRLSLQSCRRKQHFHTTSNAAIGSWFRSLFPGKNYFLENLTKAYPVLLIQSTSTGTSTNNNNHESFLDNDKKFDRLPDFRYVKAHQAIPTYKVIAETLTRDLNAFASTLPTDQEARSDKNSMQTLKQYLAQLDSIYAPIRAFMETVILLDDAVETPESKADYEAVYNQFDYALPRLVDTAIIHSIQTLVSLIKIKYDGDDSNHSLKNDRETMEALRAADFILWKHARTTGSEIVDDQEQATFASYAAALERAADAILESSEHEPVTKQTIGQMYQWIGLRNEMSKLLGYPNFVQESFERRMATTQQVQALQETVRDRVLPHVYSKPPTASIISKDLNEMLTGARPAGARPVSSTLVQDSNRLPDEFEQARLQDYVSLDGAMLFASQLCESLAGVTFARDEHKDGKGWDMEVQLYHAYRNKDEYLGSFYLDPCERHGKNQKAQAMFLYNRGPRFAPVVAVSTAIEPRTWDSDPIMLTFDDLRELLHEMGHVLDYLLAPIRYGSIAGPHESFPLDRAELVARFMEHWLTDRQVINGLIAASGCVEGPSEESLEATFRVNRDRKLQDLVHIAYISSLEMHLFSEFDLKGDETLVALQQRWAETWHPSITPAANDIKAISEIMTKNTRGQHILGYRNLWCEAVSANLYLYIKEKHLSGAYTPEELQKEFRRHGLWGSILFNKTPQPKDWSDPQAIFDIYDL
jgi:Zn-dependent oligopeptidase